MNFNLILYALIGIFAVILVVVLAMAIWRAADKVKRRYGFGELGWFLTLIFLVNIPPLLLWVYFFMEDDPPEPPKNDE